MKIIFAIAVLFNISLFGQTRGLRTVDYENRGISSEQARGVANTQNSSMTPAQQKEVMEQLEKIKKIREEQMELLNELEASGEI